MFREIINTRTCTSILIVTAGHEVIIDIPYPLIGMSLTMDKSTGIHIFRSTKRYRIKILKKFTCEIVEL